MRKLALMITVGLILFLAGYVYIAESYSPDSLEGDEYKVVSVSDGDTIEVSKYGKTQKVRFIGIDTPETVDPRKPVQCFGQEASQKTKSLLSNQNVKLEFDPIVGNEDKYGRLLAYVWLDGKLINQELLEQGYASEYTYRSQAYKYQSEFKSAQSSAKENGIGFWSEQTCSGKR